MRLIVWPISRSLAESCLKINNPNVREIILGKYRLIYRIRSGDVQILTVHHGARELTIKELEDSA